MTTEPDVPTESDLPLEPPPSSFAGSVLSRDSEVRLLLWVPLGMPTERSQEPEEVSPHTSATARPLPLRGCPAYEKLTVREKLDVSLYFQIFAGGTDRSLRRDSIVRIFLCPKPFYRYCFGGAVTGLQPRFAQSKRKNGCTASGWPSSNKAPIGSVTSSVKETCSVEGGG